MLATPNPALPQVNSALQRSATAQYWQRVQDAGYSTAQKAHLYLVPSQSRPEVEHVVAVTPKGVAPAAPIWGRFACTCEARGRAACLHRAAVYQHLYLARYGAIPRALARPKPAQPAPAPAQQPASPPPGGAAAQAPAPRPSILEPARPGARPGPRRVALT